jgi:hypothetical protein
MLKRLGSSNPPLSATESSLCAFSAQSGGIARACGLICVTHGTGENQFPAFRAQDAAAALTTLES